MTNRILLIGILSGIEVLKVAVAQVEVIPGGFWEIAKDFPALVLFLAALYYLMRWFDKMLEAERSGLKDIYASNQQFLGTLLSQIEHKQEKMDISSEDLTKEVMILRGTLTEVAKVDDVEVEFSEFTGEFTEFSIC